MLEGVLEKFLLKFLAPYVDGIARDRLRLDSTRGSLEMKSLTVKPGAPMMLGLKGFRAAKSEIRCITIRIPFSSLFTGKISVEINVVHLQVEHVGEGCSDEEALEEMRTAKRSEIDLRTSMLRELAEKSSHQEEDADKQHTSTAASIVRKVLQNLMIEINDTRFSLTSDKAQFGIGLDLPKLHLRSADEKFISTAAAEDARGDELYKQVLVEGLGVRMAKAGRTSLEGAEHIISPITVSLNVVHVPRKATLQVHIDVANVGTVLRRSELKHLLALSQQRSRESLRLEALLVPPEIAQRYDVEAELTTALENYAEVFRKQRLSELGGQVEAHEITTEDQEAMSRYEDVLPVVLLARRRLAVLRELEVLEKEVHRREEVKQAAKASRWNWFGRSKAAADTDHEVVVMTEEERERLLAQAREEAQADPPVEVPQQFEFYLTLGKTSLHLVDDREESEREREVLSVICNGGSISTKVELREDHRGQPSAQFNVDVKLCTFACTHRGESLIYFVATDGFHNPDAHAARLTVDNNLEAKRNCLVITLDSTPFDLVLLPGVVEPITEFFVAPAYSATLSSPVHLQQQQPQQQGDRPWDGIETGEYVTGIYERLPDALMLKVKVAAPRVRLPMNSIGCATARFGTLSLETPEACAYDNIQLRCGLADVMLQAEAPSGENFHILQPTSVNVDVVYISEALQNVVTVQVAAEELSLSMAPQGVQILLAVPNVIVNALAKEGEQGAPTRNASIASDASGVAELRSRDRTSTLSKEPPTNSYLTAVNLKEFATAKQRVDEVINNTLKVNVGVSLRSVDIRLSDSIIPVARLHVELPQPGFVFDMVSSQEASVQDMRISSASVEVDFRNPRHGQWEPLLEYFPFGFEMQSKVDPDGVPSMDIQVSSQQPLLLNVTPSMVKMTTWFVPTIVSCVQSGLSMQQIADDGPCGDASAALREKKQVRYRAINLCEESFTVHFASRYKGDLMMEIPQTGSRWLSLDGHVLPHFATLLTVTPTGVPPDPHALPLHLERGTGIVAIPGASQVYAELITPHPSHRMLLISGPLRLHNRTDLCVEVRFHDAAERTHCGASQSACDAEDIGLADVWGAGHGTSKVCGDAIELAPNMICTVPRAALRVSKESVRAKVSFRPAGTAAFSPAADIGSDVDAQILSTPPRGDAPTAHVICGESPSDGSFADARAEVTTVCFRPTLTVVNALPVPLLSVGVSTAQEQGEWQEVVTPSLGRRAIYGCPYVLTYGAVVRARFGDWEGSAWSGVARFTGQVLEGSETAGAATAMIDVHQGNSAAAGICVNPIGGYQLRFECRRWFMDRVGLAPFGHQLRLFRGKKALPHFAGITLLSDKCEQEEYSLHLMREEENGEIAESIHDQALRIPDAWEGYPMETPLGKLTLCMQSDALRACDICGARVNVVTLRPRLVLTNAADSKVVVKLSGHDAEEHQLESGASSICHFRVHKGDEHAASVGVKFMVPDDKVSNKNSKVWLFSPLVHLGDDGAGIQPVSLVAKHDPRNIQVWSVEVSPHRGALAVTFKRGSTLVAVNHAKHSRIAMVVKIKGCPPSVPPLHVGADGKEHEFGWFDMSQSKTIKIGLEGRRGAMLLDPSDGWKIDNLYYKDRREFPEFGVVVQIERRSGRTYVSLHDLASRGGRGGGGDSPKAQAAVVAVAGACRIAVAVRLASIGISLVQEAPRPQEIFYFQLDLIRVQCAIDEHAVTTLRLLVSDVQLDCQLPGRTDAGRTSQLVKQRQKAEEAAMGLLQRDKRAVLLANSGEGERLFLRFSVSYSCYSPSDFHVHGATCDWDALDFVVDDEWVDCVQAFMREAMQGDESTFGLSLQHIRDVAGVSILEGYQMPALPFLVQVDSLSISEVRWVMWAALRLHFLSFLRPQVRHLIRVLAMSEELKLDAVKLVLKKRSLPPARGSLGDFMGGLVSMYTIDLVQAAASALGRSSLLTIPRVPIMAVGGGASFVTAGFGIIAEELASGLDKVSMDREYIERQQAVRQNKKITGVMQGLTEAGRSVGQGFEEGIKDLFRKPGDGFKQKGVGGFFTGAAKGLAGAVAKPLAGVGSAISDVGHGISAQVGQLSGVESMDFQRVCARARTRLPRLLYTRDQALRPWSALDAAVLRQLGRIHMRGAAAVLPLDDREAGAVLVLFDDHFLIREAHAEQKTDKAAARGGAGSMLFSHAMKPLSTVRAVTSDVPTTEMVDVHGDPDMVNETTSYTFDTFHTCQWVDGIQSDLALCFGSQAPIDMRIPMRAAPVGNVVRLALGEGFQTALVHDSDDAGVADWTQLVESLELEKRGAHRKIEVGPSRSSGGELIIEVFELESKNPVTQAWSTPTLVGDVLTDNSWRWVDALGKRHPKLAKNLSKVEITRAREPPCELDMLTALGPWEVDKGPSKLGPCDADGWRYANNFQAVIWERKPAFFNMARKRRWLRTYG